VSNRDINGAHNADGYQDADNWRKDGKCDSIDPSVITPYARSIFTIRPAIPASFRITSDPAVLIGVVVETQWYGQDGSPQGKDQDGSVKPILYPTELVVRAPMLDAQIVKVGESGAVQRCGQ
jgi:hypothetical protein